MPLETVIALSRLDSIHGLSRLEQSLGLARPRLAGVDRLFRYAAACEKINKPSWRESLKVDRFGTAMHLLRRREDALMAGWEIRLHSDIG